MKLLDPVDSPLLPSACDEACHVHGSDNSLGAAFLKLSHRRCDETAEPCDVGGRRGFCFASQDQVVARPVECLELEDSDRFNDSSSQEPSAVEVLVWRRLCERPCQCVCLVVRACFSSGFDHRTSHVFLVEMMRGRHVLCTYIELCGTSQRHGGAITDVQDDCRGPACEAPVLE